MLTVRAPACSPTTSIRTPVDTRTVVAVNGSAANVGTQITLASGALLTVNADGSVRVRPDGVAAFQAWPPASPPPIRSPTPCRTRAAVLSTATVTITITGVNDGPAIDLDADDSGGAARRELPVHVHRRRSGAVHRGRGRRDDHRRRQHDLSTLTVTLTNLLDPTFEVLDVDSDRRSANFTKAYDTTTDPAQGVLAITTTTPQPIADFQTLLRRVTYGNTDTIRTRRRGSSPSSPTTASATATRRPAR